MAKVAEELTQADDAADGEPHGRDGHEGRLDQDIADQEVQRPGVRSEEPSLEKE